MMGYTIWPDGSTGDVLQAVYCERLRQEELMLKGRFYWTCSSRKRAAIAGAGPISNAEKLAVLAEEFGEVGREVTEELIARDRERVNSASAEVTSVAIKAETKKLKEELIQLAAVAVAWAESLP